MAQLNEQFTATLSNIEISGAKLERAKQAHKEIRDFLERNFYLQEWGIDSILIGSYSRQTAIYPGKDVDVMARLDNMYSLYADPRAVYDRVLKVLEEKYGLAGNGGRVTPRSRSIKVDFPRRYENAQDSSFAVDVVPAVHHCMEWGIPSRESSQWSSGPAHWVTTNPMKFGDLTTQLNKSSMKVSGQSAYIPIVKLMRQAKKQHFSDRRPNGLYVELATYDVWSNGMVSGSDWASLFTSTLEQVAIRFSNAVSCPIKDPALNVPAEPKLEAFEAQHAYKKFSELAEKAKTALDSDRCQAATMWREILGENEKGHVFPLPPGCN